MMTLSWTMPVDVDGAEVISREKLWKSLLSKAETPFDYVPAITDCWVIERFADGFLREIVRNGQVLRQRVTPEPMRRIVFRHIDDPDVASITNIIGEDGSGGITFTIEVEMADAGERTALAQSDLLRATDEYFSSTINAIVTTLRPLATAER